MNKVVEKKRNLWSYYPVTALTAIICCILWGSAPAAIKTAYRIFQITDTASRITLAGVRFALAGVMIIGFASIMQRRLLIPRRSSLLPIIILASFQTVGQYYFYFMSLAHISGVRGTVINAFGNFLVILFAAILFRMEKLSVRNLIGCIIGFAGIVVILDGVKGFVEGGSFSLAGEGAMIIADIFYALSACCIKFFSNREDPILLSGYQFLLGGAVLTMIGLLMGGKLVFYEPACYAVLIYMGFISAGAYTLWGILLKYNPVSRVAVLGFFNPVFGVLLSALILGENQEAFSINSIVAVILVSVGIVIVNTATKSK